MNILFSKNYPGFGCSGAKPAKNCNTEVHSLKWTDRNACKKRESGTLAKGSNSEQLQYKLGDKKTFHTYTDADISFNKRQKPGFLPGNLKAYPDWTY